MPRDYTEEQLVELSRSPRLERGWRCRSVGTRAKFTRPNARQPVKTSAPQSAKNLNGVERAAFTKASGHLRRFRELDLLAMQGASSRTYYVAGPRFLASPPAPMPVPEVSTIPRNIHQAAPNSRQLSVDSRLLLGRQQKPLVRDDLTPMVGEAMLAHAIPEMENHPDQRCTVLIADAGTGSPP